MFLVKCLYGVDFSLVSPVNALKRVQSPVLLIHGGEDSTVPVDEAFQLSDVFQNPASRLWIVPEAEHTDAYLSRPKEYVSRLLSFFGNVFAAGTVASPAPGLQAAPG
jgi:dipeptidyl aminopeptidase/acylaminoacyl peptidase